MGDRMLQLAREAGLDSDRFDHLVSLAQSIFEMPVVIITFIDAYQAVFRCNAGLVCDSIPLDQSVSAILAQLPPDEALLITDATSDARVANHPMVTGDDGLRSCAGIAIRSATGDLIGTFAVADRRPRSDFPQPALAQLRTLGRLAGSIAEQVRCERLQAEQLQMLSMAEQMSGVGTWKVDFRTERVHWSEEVYRIHGLTPADYEPVVEDSIHFYHPDDQAVVRACLVKARATGAPFEFKLRLRRPDGQERIVVSRGAAQRSDAGEVVVVFGVLQDVTEPEQAATRLSRSEARYRLLANRATDVIACYGVDGILTYISPSIVAMSGYRPEELIGRPATTLIHAEDIPAVAESFRQFVRANSADAIRGVRYRAAAKNGEFRWCEARTTMVRDETGRVVEFQDVVRDISETKALEDELISARDRAEAAANAKSEFLSNMSHELRTPLTSVIGFADLLAASRALQEDERRCADRIRSGSTALLAVINDILDYSKLEAGAVDLDPRGFDVRRLARDTAEIVEQQCRSKGLALTVDLSPELPPALVGDDGRLRQVLLNLLSNAVKFTARGKVCLRVGGVSAASAWRLRVEVEDTGIGIAEDQRERLFERFSQADSSTTRTYGGTGLGLAISRRLIERMHGTFGVDSEPGAGSTFWFEVALPVATCADVAEEVATAVLAAGARILVVDDVAANRELVSALVAGFGMDVSLACDGAEAVEAAIGGGLDLILMDMHMPVMDGLQATRAIRALGGPRSEVPIIALTANVSQEQIDRCLAAGMNDHVAKPIRIEALARALGDWLSDRSPAGTGAQVA